MNGTGGCVPRKGDTLPYYLKHFDEEEDEELEEPEQGEDEEEDEDEEEPSRRNL
jgi:hypothetical protein